MNNQAAMIAQILESATSSIQKLRSQVVDIIEVQKPTSIQYALQLTKIVSKLSPMLGNLFEFRIVDELNANNTLPIEGQWVRQDPGFPDACFKSDKLAVHNTGVEIKAWFPFATEITGRFKDSEDIFLKNQINVAIIAWLPEYVFWGKPVIIDTLIVSGKSVAEARDKHYHKPPHYLVIEPENTSSRTGNLQQTNTAGFVFQDEKTLNKEMYRNASLEVAGWSKDELNYSTSPAYQQKMKDLMAKYIYRNDTNYGKIDRIQHAEIESFKTKIYETEYKGRTIKEWAALASMDCHNPQLASAIEQLLLA